VFVFCSPNYGKNEHAQETGIPLQRASRNK
jgi:hypothetical protein